MKKKIHSTFHVHKFGGTSLANAERFTALKKILKGKNEIIVSSAVYGTTSSLQSALDIAKKNGMYQEILIELKNKHVQLIHKLVKKNKKRELVAAIEKDIGKIKDILHAVALTEEYSKSIQKYILGYGEIWSTKILSEYLSESHQVLFLNASEILFVFEKNGVVCVDWSRSQRALDVFLSKNKKFDQICVTGFIASNLEGKRTILGRNGSDFSAGIFAKLFKAENLTIWTDVNGIYTADPNRVRAAFVIPSLSYKEALELAYFGAKVLHPLTVLPLLEDKIPLRIKNSFDLSHAGTYISATSQKTDHPVKGLACIDDIALINIEGAGMTGVSGMAFRVFQILYHENISVILIAQASSEHSICFAISKQNAAVAVKALNENLKFELQHQQIEKIYMNEDCAILSAVGDGMIGVLGVSGKLCHSLADANINIRAISQGASERNISVVIDRDNINKALQAVHAGFYLSPKTLSIGIIGPGQVGRCLLNQVEHALKQIQDNLKANLLVRGVMNSKKMLLSHHAISLSTWKDQFDKSNIKSNLEEFVKHIISDNMPHSVIIDCTANQYIASQYVNFFEKGIHVVTPNKYANAGDLNYYNKMKEIIQKKNIHYFYEATVCAGLPVITTLSDFIKTGDTIERIEGIVSGTLSYIFNELAKSHKKFSEVVLEAKNLGYTEPDPREDLSGMDVARKFVCLAREIGFKVNLKDIKVHDLVPQELKQCDLKSYLKKLPICDENMHKMIEKAQSKNEKLAYSGIISREGKIQVAIKSFSENHPFSRLNGTDNMLLFYTKRYHTQPLVIQGPGAGAEVTAAGIFSDLLRLVSFLND